MLEIIAAGAMFAVLVGGMVSLFHLTLRMREDTYNRIEATLPRSYMLSIVRRDLAATAPLLGEMIVDLIGEKDNARGERRDSLEFCSASGALGDNDPWGDILRIEYYLLESEETEGFDLMRRETRNLLGDQDEDDLEAKILLSGVATLEFSYYDGEEWLEEWDTSEEEESTEGEEEEKPVLMAIRMRVEFVRPEEGDRRVASMEELAPLELTVPVLMEAYELIEPPEEEEEEGGEAAAGGDGGGAAAQPAGGAGGGGR